MWLPWVVMILASVTTPKPGQYVPLPGGTFASVIGADDKGAPAQIRPFKLRTEPVTNAEFLAFVMKNPQWRRDRVASVLADRQYLSQWASADKLGPGALPQQPVTRVSWFAAQAYCESENARLPSWYEWEYAAAADAHREDARQDPAWRDAVLNWYSRPSNTPLPTIGGEANIHGVRDMNGLVWEWVDDFNALLVSGDGREQDGADKLRFCGAGAANLEQKENYATLMRVAMLSAVKAADTTNNMGFRCARND
ncbi:MULTISPECIES: formylglycine-generating enzyme family protein [Dyella]|uniref:Formylglycine-generating enzyme family protein n=2 Tax=Dyella TaxID=231454 RepID=A0A4R0YY89_9GAMM|nr:MULTISPECIES: formylglycine-generating enzyme family protein [Dyella]TBR40430.1 formylglycine-generating enzyme family protein [Dyella terrae]TCI11988.1 formylglycine-generating enzyme family protein [Dyella soli]